MSCESVWWERMRSAGAVPELWLPCAGMAEVRAWTCREASHIASLSWTWASARTHYCLLSPLCLQGASPSWICLPLQAYMGCNAHRHTGCINRTLTRARVQTVAESVQPVRVKGASVPWQAHVVLHLQCSVLFFLTDVFSFELVLSLYNAPQHLTVGKLSIHLHTEGSRGTTLEKWATPTICCSALFTVTLLTLILNSSTWGRRKVVNCLELPIA